mmetsp:Transcript_3327/g.4661  ORF Transcript_3327/g.4661 Transcript_3327/m.4661 type:complete len:116 (-) Transcript_3327:3201-3548(-)
MQAPNQSIVSPTNLIKLSLPTQQTQDDEYIDISTIQSNDKSEDKTIITLTDMPQNLKLHMQNDLNTSLQQIQIPINPQGKEQSIPVRPVDCLSSSTGNMFGCHLRKCISHLHIAI